MKSIVSELNKKIYSNNQKMMRRYKKKKEKDGEKHQAYLDRLKQKASAKMRSQK